MHARYQAVIGLLVAVLVSGCGAELAAKPAEPPTPSPVPTRPPYDPSELKTVERRDILDSITGRATVAPKLTDDLFFRRDGRIATVEVSAGAEVQKGQVLARLEQTDLEYQIGLAKIDVDLATLKERDARDKKVAAVDLAIATKELERAKLALERLQTEQQSLIVAAPYAGRISDLKAKAGAQVEAYTPVATIVGTEELVIIAEFSGPKAGRVAVGQQVDLRDFFDTKISFKGTIAGKGEGPGTTLVVEPAAGAPKVKLGDTLKVTAVLGRAEKALAIPSGAVKTIGERHYVLLVDKGALRRVFIETGIESDGVVEVKSGLQEGQHISEH